MSGQNDAVQFYKHRKDEQCNGAAKKGPTWQNPAGVTKSRICPAAARFPWTAGWAQS